MMHLQHKGAPMGNDPIKNKYIKSHFYIIGAIVGSIDSIGLSDEKAREMALLATVSLDLQPDRENAETEAVYNQISCPSEWIHSVYYEICRDVVKIARGEEAGARGRHRAGFKDGYREAIEEMDSQLDVMRSRFYEPPEPEKITWKVWAIQHELRSRGVVTTHTVAVSAESEYGAIKRLCGSRGATVKLVEVIEGRKPEYDQRRIEGRVEHEFSNPEEYWEYR